jgi:hypothetical protein
LSSTTLRSGRKGQFSIRPNDQFRICFKWEAKGPIHVEITDYPKGEKKLPPIHPGKILLEDMRNEEISIDNRRGRSAYRRTASA